MSAPSEPEKYSVEEMMERLKNRQTTSAAAEGERVTRADGSQAVRVRKRKRRSQQPHKELHQQTRRTRMFQVSAALALILLAAFGVGTAIIFANSAPFRQKILSQIAQSSGATVELEQFRMTPTSANAYQVSLTWPDGSALQSLTLHGVKAAISPASFLGRSLTGEELSCAEGTLIVRAPRAGRPTRATPASAERLPVRFQRYAIPKAEVVIGDPSAPLVRMLNSEASFYPISANERAQLLLSRGDLTIPGWPKLHLDRSHIEFRSGEVEIVVLRLRHDTDRQGVFELTGTLTPYATQRASTLAIRLESYLLSGIAGPELGRLVTGRIDTLADGNVNGLTFTPGPEPAATLAITFRNSLTSKIELTGFAFLPELARALGDSWFERPVFENEVHGTLRRAAGTVTMGDLHFENKDRMAVHGTLEMTPDQTLSGQLEIGVATAMIEDALILSSKPHVLDAMFGPPRGGFRWLTLKIGGPASAPTDNFKDLFAAAARTQPTAAKRTIPTFEELTTPK